MRFEVVNVDQIGFELQQICLELTADSRLALALWDKDPSSSIHHLRTNMKKIRAIFRLTKKMLPSNKLSAAVGLVRTIKDYYKSTRDEEIMRTTLLKVTGNSVEALANKLFHSTKRSPNSPPKQLFEQIESLAEAIAMLPFQKITLSAVNKAFLSTLKRGAVAMEKCKKRGSRVCFHNWRKRMKDAWYQSALLSFQENLETTIAKEASDCLGESNDLSNLKARLQKAKSVAVPKWIIQDVKQALKRTRHQALEAGEKFYESLRIADCELRIPD